MNRNAKDESVDRIRQILSRAELDGFGDKCALAACAINEVLFARHGRYVSVSNRAFRDRGMIFGHVVVEYLGCYWDSRGTISRAALLEYGVASQKDLESIGISDYSLATEVHIDTWPLETFPTMEEKTICDAFILRLLTVLESYRV